MYKIAAIIGGILLLAGVALAGAVTSLGSTSSSPTVGFTTPLTDTSVRQEDRAREREARGRANEAGEDLRGPCDEAEHANDPRCKGAATAPVREDADDDANDDRGARSGHDAGDDRGGNSGPSDNSGRGGGSDDGGHSGHSGGGDDD